MKAKLKNGKIITGKAAEVFVKKGIAGAKEIKHGRPKKTEEETAGAEAPAPPVKKAKK